MHFLQNTFILTVLNGHMLIKKGRTISKIARISRNNSALSVLITLHFSKPPFILNSEYKDDKAGTPEKENLQCRQEHTHHTHDGDAPKQVSGRAEQK
jgi:hypothetical protein